MKTQKQLPDYVNGFKVVTDLGVIKGCRYADFECPECKKPFRLQITNARSRKKRDCGCVPKVNVFHEVNGFKIVRDDGRIGRNRPGRAVCKACGNEFECNIYNLRYNKGCGCINPCPAPELDPVVNGFKILQDLGVVNNNRRVKCICKRCGNIFDAQVQNLKTAKGCKCMMGAPIICTYKASHPRLFRIYKCMKARCNDNNHKSFHNYGARGIGVNDQWSNDPDSFCIWAISNGYEDALSLDRIDNNKGYSPENCRWATATEQMRHTRKNVLNEKMVIEIRKEDRKIMTIQKIANKYGVKRGAVSHVLNNKTWRDV